MGADIHAIIQIDDNTPTDQPPFTCDPSTWDLRGDLGLTGGKHYEFFAAICGVRNATEKEPLFPCRGYPPNIYPTDPLECFGDDLNLSWLTLSEIMAALNHHNVTIENLRRPVQLVLRTMAAAENLFGKDRVRLVFRVDD